jgi:ABC-2 type transport system permease protein
VLTRPVQLGARPVVVPAGRLSGGCTLRPLAALAVRDFTARNILGLPLALDLTFGIVNLLVFLFISRALTLPERAVFTHSATYFDFVAVGITFMLILQAASTQLIAKLSREQRDGTLEMLAVQPMRTWSLAVGLAAYPFIVALLRAGVYLAVLGVLLGLHVGQASWIGVVLMLILGSVATMGIGIGLMACTIVVGHGDAVARMLVVGLSFASGTYFPAAALPHGLREVSAVVPTRVALDGLRAALAGGDWASRAASLLTVVPVLLPMSILLFSGALKLAVRRGMLSRG